jgi:hypothetical protein
MYLRNSLRRKMDETKAFKSDIWVSDIKVKDAKVVSNKRNRILLL